MTFNLRATVRRSADHYLPGLAARYRKARDDRKQHGEPIRTPWGFSLVGDPGLAESRNQSHEVDTFLDQLRGSDYVVDVGANAGLFTLLAASRGVQVTAFEPNTANVAVLCGNLRANDFRVEVLPIALGNQTGVLELYGGGQGASLVRGWGGMLSTYSTLVPIGTLDELLADRLAARQALVKIDAEGYEFPILQGAMRLIGADPAPSWIVEVGLTENFNGAVNPHFSAIFELFWAAGYKAHTVEADRPVIPSDVAAWLAAKDRGFWNINYLFTKER